MQSEIQRSGQNVAYCRDYLRQKSAALYYATLGLSPRVRDGVSVLLAMASDITIAIKQHGVGEADVLRQRTRVLVAHEGSPKDHALDRAYAHLVYQHRIPQELFLAQIEGLGWDLDKRRYHSLEALEDYAVRVGGALAMAFAIVMGRRSEDVLARACDLGLAIRLTTLARDVGRHARSGRVYLPLEGREEAGVDPDLLLERPAPSPALAKVTERLLSVADGYYLRADPGIAELPLDCRPAVRTLRYVYSALGHELERAEYDSISHRVRVALPRTVKLWARALRAPRSEQRASSGEVAPAARPLIAAVKC